MNFQPFQQIFSAVIFTKPQTQRELVQYPDSTEQTSKSICCDFSFSQSSRPSTAAMTDDLRTHLLKHTPNPELWGSGPLKGWEDGCLLGVSSKNSCESCRSPCGVKSGHVWAALRMLFLDVWRTPRPPTPPKNLHITLWASLCPNRHAQIRVANIDANTPHFAGLSTIFLLHSMQTYCLRFFVVLNVLI